MDHLLHDTLPPGLPAALAGLRAPCYLHRPPSGKLWLLLGVALATVVALLGYTAWNLANGSGDPAHLALAAFLLLFLVPLLRRSTWEPPISMAADERGLWFLGSDHRQPAVFVAWVEVGTITVERTSAGGDGVSRMAVVLIADESAFWDRAKQSAFATWMLGAAAPDGKRRLPIGNPGLPPEQTRDALESLRHRSASRA